MNNLLAHFKKCAKDSMKQDNFEASWKVDEMFKTRKQFFIKDKIDDWVNLKELRDQILMKRCSNGMLFMYGVSNEGRLGV